MKATLHNQGGKHPFTATKKELEVSIKWYKECIERNKDNEGLQCFLAQCRNSLAVCLAAYSDFIGKK